MAKGFEVKVPISVEGKTGKAGKGLADDFLKNIKGKFTGFGTSKSAGGTDGMLHGIGKIAASVGIIASIWQGIAPIFKPVLKMFSILLTLLLLPLMPLIKQMVSGLAKTAGKVSEAQKEAGGTGFGAFATGFGEIMKSPTIWAIAGAGLATSFAMSLLGGGGLVGAFALAIGLGLVFTSIGEDELKNKVGAAGLIGLSAGIATAMATGNPIAGALVGAISFSLASEFIFGEISLKDIEDAIKSAGIASVAVGGLASLFFGLPGFVIAGSLTFALSLIFDLIRPKDPYKDFIEKEEEYFGQHFGQTRQFTDFKLPSEIQRDIDRIDWGNMTSGIENATSNWMKLNSTISTDTQYINISIDGLGKMIGSSNKGSYPLVYAMNLAGVSFTNFKNLMVGMITGEINPQVSWLGLLFVTQLKQIEEEWVIMKDVSVEAINNVINNLNRIPREITTTHYIRTVTL